MYQAKIPGRNCLFSSLREIDEDESGSLEFPEFVQLAAKFLIEEDEEQTKWELREAFRIYDKQGEKRCDQIWWYLSKISYFCDQIW